MLIQALTAHFRQQFAHHEYCDAVLWFDPDREYAALLEHLTAFPIWHYAGSMLEIRYKLIHRATAERVIVYLPLKEKDAEALRPFFTTSYPFSTSLYKFLRQQGLHFPDDPTVAHQLRQLLPRLAVRSIGKGRIFWEHNLANLERARETLLGNFDDALLRFLADPHAAHAELQKDHLAELFFAQLASRYDLTAAPEDDPEAVAERLTAQLVLTRAYVTAEKPADFPYMARLPQPLYFEPSQTFLKRWQRDRAHKGHFVRRADALERQYNLAGWVEKLPLAIALELGATWANVEDALWRRVTQKLAQLSTAAEWRAWLTQYQPQFTRRATNFWAQEGRAACWEVLARAAALLTAIQQMGAEVDELSTASAVLRRYANAWWRIDHDFRQLRQTWNAPARGYERLRDHIGRAYHTALRRMNDRFSELLSLEPADAPPGLPAQDRFWAEEVAPALRKDKRVAVLFIDALRYELAQELHAALTAEAVGDQCTLTARRAALPTITPIGMTALLPQGDERRVSYDQDWRITIAKSGNLKDKARRVEWLQHGLSNLNIAFYNLGEFVETTIPAPAAPDVYLIFDTTLDAVGENIGTRAWTLFSALLSAVQQGINKLLAVGVERIYVVTDHGFLLQDEVHEYAKVSVAPGAAAAVKARYAVGDHLGQTAQLRYAVPGSDSLIAWFPRGTGCFRTPGAYEYVHGGLSLQELVVPQMVITQQVMGQPVGVRAALPAIIHNAQPQVTLEPVAAELLAQPRQVRLTLDKAGAPLMPPLSAVVKPNEPSVINVLLPMGCGLESGDKVRWMLTDAVTGEVLAEQDAVSQTEVW